LGLAPGAILFALNVQEVTMRRLFLAAAFSLGLVASGSVLAAPDVAAHAVAEAGPAATPVQYRDRRDDHRRGHRVAPYHVAPRYFAPRYPIPRHVAPLRHPGRAYPAQQRHGWQAPPRGHRYGWR
jgi:hypothetical protein